MSRRIYCPPRRHARPDGRGTTPGVKFRHALLLPPEFGRAREPMFPAGRSPARGPMFRAGAGCL
jgi:hypothetical protein